MATESKLQTKIINDLTNKGWYVLKVKLCNKPGHPDLEAAGHGGKMVYIECKAEGKKAQPLQEFRHEELRQRGFKVYVIDSWELYKSLNL